MTRVTVARNGRLCCDIVLQGNDDPVLPFAKQELRRHLKRSAPAKGRNPKTSRIILLASDESGDGFRVSAEKDAVTIHGSNPRSLLVAVYAFLKRVCGYRWYAPDQEIAPRNRTLELRLDKPWEEKALFNRRGLYAEGSGFGLGFLRRLIDWCPKNNISDLTFSMSAWPEWKERVGTQLGKRGLRLNLSGHCLPKFVPRDLFEKHPDWFALVGGQRIPHGQYCFSSPGFNRHLIKEMLDFIGAEPLLARMSIWAQDTSLVCECPACRKKGFMKSFVDSINRLAAACEKRARKVKIEFLAYNAGLAWEMLEPDKSLFPLKCSTELAYWGRDYRYDFARSPAAGDRRAKKCFQRWRKNSDRTLNLLEYYTDVWMLTHLITAQPDIIARDMGEYARLGIDDICTLIVSCAYSLGDRTFSRAEVARKIYPNMYFFARNAWRPDPGVLKDYCEKLYLQNSTYCEKVLRHLEKVLGEVSSFNIDLFRLRFVDPWRRDATPKSAGPRRRNISQRPWIWRRAFPERAGRIAGSGSNTAEPPRLLLEHPRPAHDPSFRPGRSLEIW